MIETPPRRYRNLGRTKSRHSQGRLSNFSVRRIGENLGVTLRMAFFWPGRIPLIREFLQSFFSVFASLRGPVSRCRERLCVAPGLLDARAVSDAAMHAGERLDELLALYLLA